MKFIQNNKQTKDHLNNSVQDKHSLKRSYSFRDVLRFLKNSTQFIFGWGTLSMQQLKGGIKVLVRSSIDQKRENHEFEGKKKEKVLDIATVQFKKNCSGYERDG